MNLINSSIALNCHHDAVLPIYNWLLEYFKDNKNVAIFKRKEFVSFKKQYKNKNKSQFTIVVATDEGDDYIETDQCLLDYVSTYNPQTKKLIFVGFDSVPLDSKIKKISLVYSLYSYFYNIKDVVIPNIDLSEIKKPGATLINRVDASRLKTFSSYVKNNLPIYISVNGFIERNLPKDKNLNFLKENCYDKDSEHFKDIDIDKIISMIPYRNFAEQINKNPQENDIFSENYTFPKELAKHSLFFLVNETYNSTYFTEKTLIPFSFKKIGLWNNYNAIDKLRNIGFDMFDDIIDHSYQYIRNDFERQDILLNEFIKVINNINSIDLNEINTRLNKNQKFLYKDLKDLFIQEQTVTFNSIKKEYFKLFNI